MALLVVFAALALRLFVFVYHHSVNVLFWDQWDYYQPLFEGKGPWSLFTWQHGPHRQGLGFWVTGVLGYFSGWNMRVEAFFTVWVYLTTGLMAVEIKRRLLGSYQLSDVIIPLIFLRTGYWETLVDTNNLSYGVFPLFLVVLFCLLLVCRWHSPVRALALALVGFCATFTGFGLFLGMLAPLVFLKEWRRTGGWSYLWGGLGCVASMVLFLVGYRNMPAVEGFQFPHPRPWEYVGFVARELSMLVGFYGDYLPARVVGYGLLAGFVFLCAWALRRWWRKGDELAQVGFVLISFSGLFMAFSAVGRVGLGPEAAFSSRYVPYLLPVLLLFYLVSLKHVPARARTFWFSAWVFVFVFSELVLTPLFFSEVPERMAKRRDWVACYRTSHSIERCDSQVGIKLHPDAARTGLEGKLNFLEKKQLSLFAP